MKIGILADQVHGFVRPMAEGLERMLSRIGVHGEMFYDGLEALRRMRPRLGLAAGDPARESAKKIVRWGLQDVPSYRRFIRRLSSCDAIIVVDSMPRAFFKDVWRIEELRQVLPKIPIVLYDVYYLPTRGPWAAWLKRGNPDKGIPHGGHWGLERFDWYLCASVVSEFPMPSAPQPCTIIGLDLDDGTLQPEPKEEFLALLDFEHPPDMLERAIQIVACEQTKTKYVVLHGRYSISDIRAIYRRTSIYFLAMRESFGLPTCELQACGSYVFTPHATWAPSHWIKEDLTVPGPGTLSPNFIVYDNDQETLSRQIETIKATYDAKRVVKTFLDFHPQYYRGDTTELKKFVDMLSTGEIHSERHRDLFRWSAPGG
jgi:hypothetical protein